MSDLVFRADLIGTAPAVPAIGPVIRAVGAARVRLRGFQITAIELNDTYGLVEAVCLATAVGFTGSMFAVAFGAQF